MAAITLSSDSKTKNSLVAVSKVFARASKQMNIKEWKAFIYALTKITWTQENNNEVILDKKQLAELLGINSDMRHLSQDLLDEIGELPPHSHIIIKTADQNYCSSGTFINRIDFANNIVVIKFEPDYMKLFQKLDSANPYITMWSGDLFSMKNERAILFYEDLRLHSDTRVTNTKLYATKELKQLFDIPKQGKGSYMHFSKQKGEDIFDRANFEKYVLLPVCEDLKKCSMIRLLTTEQGNYWTKEKDGNSVIGYRFMWEIAQNQQIENDTEIPDGCIVPLELGETVSIQKEINAEYDFN